MLVGRGAAQGYFIFNRSLTLRAWPSSVQTLSSVHTFRILLILSFTLLFLFLSGPLK